jgi:ubiquinone/menaquinone biosynthesis C-methylase UbiE
MERSFSSRWTACCRKENQPLDARLSEKHIGAVYDRIAPIYDIWGKLTESRARDRAIELAGIKDGQHIVEVAVGTGLAFQEIVKRNPKGVNTGIDLSPGMLAKARKRLSRFSDAHYSLQLGTAGHLPVEEESVDSLINNYMFDLIPFSEMDAILREFRRVLKKEGRLILVNMTEGERFGSGLYDFIYRISPQTMGGCRGVRLTERLERNGFKVEKREYFQQMLFPSEVILAFKRQG